MWSDRFSVNFSDWSAGISGNERYLEIPKSWAGLHKNFPLITRGKEICPFNFMDLKSFKEKFERHLEIFIEKKFLSLGGYTKDKFILSLFSHTKKLICADGKRIRPYNCYLMYKNFGGKKDREIFQILIALELLHTYLLIHDDIMDKDFLRRGVLTAHIFAAQTLKKLKRRGDLNHIGIAQAICLGDLLALWSSENFTFNPGFNSLNFTKAQKYYYKMLQEVIIGQMMDVDCATKNVVSDVLISKKIFLKSAGYTFIGPFQIGAALAGAGNDDLDFCAQLGKYLGVAFQIRNDLIDIISVEKDKKTPLGDIEQGQHSFFTQYIFKKGTKRQKEDLKRYFGKKIEKKEVKKVISLFKESGAIDYGKRLIEKNLNSTQKLISSPRLINLYKTNFNEIVEMLANH